MKVLVIGGGAWGLPAAAETAARGHEVHLVDRYGVGNALSSSYGPSRIWRLADPDPARVRLARRSLEAMRRLQTPISGPLFREQGLLWRHPLSSHRVEATAIAEGLDYERVPAVEVGRILPGLVPNERNALFMREAGTLLANRMLDAQYQRFLAAGGRYSAGREAVDVEERAGGLRVRFSDGAFEDADSVVIAAGPGAKPLVEQLGLPIRLHTNLEQVVHFASPGGPAVTDRFPTFVDGYGEDEEGIYAMPSIGIGYKVGLDLPVRDFDASDPDRTPDAARTEAIRRRVERDIASLVPRVLDVQMCTWTDTPDGRFVLDALGNGIVIGCGDVGEGFKFSAVMGEILADFVDGRPQDADVRSCGIARFADSAMPEFSTPTRIGAHHGGER